MKLIPEEGNTYGKLYVTEFAGFTKQRMALWLCLCACGNETVVPGTQLRRGHTTSCGCKWLDVCKRMVKLRQRRKRRCLESTRKLLKQKKG